MGVFASRGVGVVVREASAGVGEVRGLNVPVGELLGVAAVRGEGVGRVVDREEGVGAARVGVTSEVTERVAWDVPKGDEVE